MTRPPFLFHWQDAEDADDARYPGDDERLGIGTPLGKRAGLTQIGAHHERLPPGRRTSWPHAERDEDELVYVLEGYPQVWLNGELHALRPGDVVGFPCGTGIAHTFLNDTDREVRLLVVGLASEKKTQVHYPLHPRRNEAIGTAHWTDAPAQTTGPHPGTPADPNKAPQAPIAPERRLSIPTIDTERLVLRAHELQDAAALFEMRNQPGAVEYMTSRPPSLASTEATMRRYLLQNGWNTVGWTITERQGGHFVGIIGILRINEDNSSAEMGYEIHRTHQGQGFAREAARAAIQHAFNALRLHRIELRIDPQNIPSIRTAEALNFTREGHLRQHERHEDGRWLDSLIYARLAP